ncbi:non-ribosomal peptide synthetase, partial [Aphanothece sacrum]
YFICTSQVFYQLIDSLDKTTFFSCLRQIMIVTDKLYTKEVERFWQKVSSNCILKHGYGSSETNGIAIIYLQRNSLISSKIIPAGYPIKEVKILDEQGQNLDVNEVGEIAVKSSYLSPGYWQNPQLTKEKFLPVPNDKDSRIYLTGDLGRINSDGYLEIVSRKDLMVKIRGFRIELGEIEANLKEHPKIKQTLVITQENTLEDKKIVSYFVPINNQNIYPQQLREFLKERLPHYQIPSAFVCLDSFPLTASGKIDLKSLPKVDWTTLIQQNFVAPRDEVELQLTKIWEKVLDIQPIGVKDNFFDLGGHSLLAVKLLAQIEKTMAKTLPLATLFQAPTVEELANLVQQKGKSLPWSALIPIQPNGSKPPFFCVHGGGGNILNFYPLANELGSDQPFYGLQAKGVDGQQKPYSCIEDMATHYLEEIFTIQPEGPYFLGGYCFGSLVAFEIAQQLLTKNQKVALLVFFDPIPYYKPISIKEKLFHHLVLLFQIGPTYLLKKIKKIMSQKPNKDFERAIQPETPQSIKIAHLQAYNNYVPLSYPGQVLVFSTNQEDKHQNQYWNAKIGWGSLMTKGLKFHYVYADHISLLKKPHVKELAEKLRDCIDWTLEKEIGSTGTLKELINKFDKPYE